MLQRDADHLRVWKDEAEVFAMAIGRLRQDLAAKQTELDKRPVQVVTQNLDIERVEAAVAERDQAYRSRDRAYALLSAAVLLHEPADDNKRSCTCGLAWNKCAVGRLLEDEGTGLRQWELKQRQRMLDGHTHSLPENHRFVLDQRRR